MTNSKAARVTFEELAPEDLDSAVGSLKRLRRSCVVQPKIGVGFEVFLRWALHEVMDAEKQGGSDGRERIAVSAVMNARRALACLVDQYLQRDGLCFCLSPPREADEKAQILVKRGVFDSLASKSLKRAIDQRNAVEHDYRCLRLEQAQDVVHTVRATIENALTRADPYASPGWFGTPVGGAYTSKGQAKGSFNGWSGGAFLLVTTVEQPWAGIVAPRNDTEAVVRKVKLEQISVEQLLEALSIAESRLVDQSSPSLDRNLWHAHLQSAGLLP